MLSQETLIADKDDYINDLKKSLHDSLKVQSDFTKDILSEKKSQSIYESNSVHSRQINLQKSELDTARQLIEVDKEHKKHLDESFLKILDKKVEKIDEQYSSANLGEKLFGQEAQDYVVDEKITNENLLLGESEDQGQASSDYNFNILDQELNSSNKFLGYEYKNFETTSNFENERNNKLFLFESFECCFDEIKKILEEKSMLISSMMFEKKEQEKSFNKERSDFLNNEASFKQEIAVLKKDLDQKETDLKYFENVINSDDSSTERLTDESAQDSSTLLNLVTKERNEKKILLKRITELKESNLDMAQQLIKNQGDISKNVVNINKMVEEYTDLEKDYEKSESDYSKKLQANLSQKESEIEVHNKIRLKFLQQITVLCFENEKLRNYIKLKMGKIIPAQDANMVIKRLEFMDENDKTLFYSLKDLTEHNAKLRSLLYNIRNEELNKNYDDNIFGKGVSSSDLAKLNSHGYNKKSFGYNERSNVQSNYSTSNANHDTSTKDMLKMINKLEVEIKSWESKYETLEGKSKKQLEEKVLADRNLSIIKEENCNYEIKINENNERQKSLETKLKTAEAIVFERDTQLVNAESHFLQRRHEKKISDQLEFEKYKVSPGRFGLEKNRTEADLQKLQLADKDRIIGEYKTRLKSFQELYATYGGNETRIHSQNFPDSLPSPLSMRKQSLVDLHTTAMNNQPLQDSKKRSYSFDMNRELIPDQRDLEIVREFQSFVNDFSQDLYKIRSDIKNDIDIYEQNIKNQLKEQNFKTVLKTHENKIFEQNNQIDSYQKIITNIEEVRKMTNLQLLQKLDAEGCMQLFCPTLMAIKLKDELMNYKKRFEHETGAMSRGKKEDLEKISSLEAKEEEQESKIESLENMVIKLKEEKDFVSSIVENQLGKDSMEVEEMIKYKETLRENLTLKTENTNLKSEIFDLKNQIMDMNEYNNSQQQLLQESQNENNILKNERTIFLTQINNYEQVVLMKDEGTKLQLQDLQDEINMLLYKDEYYSQKLKDLYTILDNLNPSNKDKFDTILQELTKWKHQMNFSFNNIKSSIFQKRSISEEKYRNFADNYYKKLEEIQENLAKDKELYMKIINEGDSHLIEQITSCEKELEFMKQKFNEKKDDIQKLKSSNENLNNLLEEETTKRVSIEKMNQELLKNVEGGNQQSKVAEGFSSEIDLDKLMGLLQRSTNLLKSKYDDKAQNPSNNS